MSVSTAGRGSRPSSSRSVRRLAFLVLALALLAAAPAAQADEQRPAVPLVLNLLNGPVDSPEAALQETILWKGPTPRPGARWEILPDGSARYGTANFGVIVRTPCVYGAPGAPSDLVPR